MAEAARERYISDQTAELRLLSDVMQLCRQMRPDGTVPPDALADIKTNMFTAVQEMAMPGAVTTTIQRVENRHDEQGRVERVISWLGKSAIDVAMSGYEFYVSEPGRRRGHIEVSEARHKQENMVAGQVEVCICPKMSRFDAPIEVAKAENLHDQDAVRTSYPIIDKHGEIVASRMQSLLVSDISLEDWVAMLEDPNNMFGTAFTIVERRSALSVMELFSQLSLPDVNIPEGPITIVEAVLPYIKNPVARNSVTRQIEKYRNDQQQYQRQAERIAEDWLSFDVELARSLQAGTATSKISGFIASLQHHWSPEDRRTIVCHDVAGDYVMTTELAALLEKANQHLLASQAALATGNEEVLGQTDDQTAKDLQRQIQVIETMRSSKAHPAEIAQRQAFLNRSLAQRNFRVGGGCAGDRSGTFKSGDTNNTDVTENEQEDSSENSAGWSWKKGVCRVKACTSPQPTEVGPCSVCRTCQHKFDRGVDPTTEVVTSHTVDKVKPYNFWEDIKQRRQETRERSAAKSAELVLQHA